MLSLLHTLFFFVLALAVLIAFHEYGHYWAARRLGVKVIRFSIGFGKPLWRRQSSGGTEFVVSALPLGGYVKMVDEREGEVSPADLPYAFNRQSVPRRAGIVAAGPLFNFFLAILIYWVVFMLGETGVRPVLGPVAQGTLAAEAGFREGDEILSVDGDETPTWMLAISEVVEKGMDERAIPVSVKTREGETRERILNIPAEVVQHPDALYKKLGFRPFEPNLPPVIKLIEPGSSAETVGLKPGDKVISADGIAVETWKQWVEYVRARPEALIKTVIERDGARFPVDITPKAVDAAEGKIGRIGAGVDIPEALEKSMQVEYRLGPVAAFAAATEKTVEYSGLTLRMIGRMIVGKAAVENLSGPISIAQYAGQSASSGFSHFMKFLAIVSISLGIMNLLPVPVLDGGHLLFYLVEAVKGSPVSEKTQMLCQQVGMFILLCLMTLAFVLDIDRLLS